jgi:glycosyltransferase involved in cell wall biosynthesis
LRVAHVPYTFAPDPVGGTEIYVEALARGLRAHGIESLIVAPSFNGTDEAYEHRGLRVRRYRSAPPSKEMLRELYGKGDSEAAAAFGHILDEECPDAVHIHAFTRAVSVLLVQAAKERGLPVFFTYHTPTVSCMRGTLMLRDEEECDGALMVGRCTSCYVQSRGVPRWASILLAHVPFPIARALEKANLSGGMWTGLQLSELIRTQHLAFQNFMREVDDVVALSEWVRKLLIRNGVPRSKITFSRHGAPHLEDIGEPLIDLASTPLRIAFFGRVDGSKGADTLLKAVKLIPWSSIEVHLYGISQSTAAANLWAELQSICAGDARVKFFDPIANEQIVSVLKGYHFLAVPSRGLETGPLIILESFAAGTPVIGSNLGGIAEWIRDHDNGLLVNAGDVQAWAETFRRCAEDRSLLKRLRGGVKLSRSMDDVAREMVEMYDRRIRQAFRSEPTGESKILPSQYGLP